MAWLWGSACNYCTNCPERVTSVRARPSVPCFAKCLVSAAPSAGAQWIWAWALPRSSGQGLGRPPRPCLRSSEGGSQDSKGLTLGVLSKLGQIWDLGPASQLPTAVCKLRDWASDPVGVG